MNTKNSKSLCVDVIEEVLIEKNIYFVFKKQQQKITDKKHVGKLTENWDEMATLLKHGQLLQALSCCTIASNELFYHKSNIKCCYQKFRKQ